MSPSGAVPGEVAGAVEPGLGRAERVGDEPLGGELGPVEVAARQAGAADVELAGDADGHGLRPSSRMYSSVFAIGRPIGTRDRLGLERPDLHVQAAKVVVSVGP